MRWLSRRGILPARITGYADLLLLLNNGKDVLVRRWYPDSHLLS